MYILPFLVVFCLLFKDKLDKPFKPYITKLDDNNWIVGNEFVSFEKDTEIDKLRQSNEDEQHYSSYKLNREFRDSRTITEEYFSMMRLLELKPNLVAEITSYDLIEKQLDYYKYVNMCNYLGKTTIMTHYEYCVKYKFFMDFYGQNGFGSIGMMPMDFEAGIYNVYSKSTAKYYKGNMREIIKEQFEEECYE